MEAAPFARDPCGVAGRRDHRGLLRGHRDQYVRAIDPEVGGNPHRHPQQPDDVFDHVVGLLDGQPARRQDIEAFERDAGALGDQGAPIGRRFIPETRNPACHRYLPHWAGRPCPAVPSRRRPGQRPALPTSVSCNGRETVIPTTWPNHTYLSTRERVFVPDQHPSINPGPARRPVHPAAVSRARACRRAATEMRNSGSGSRQFASNSALIRSSRCVTVLMWTWRTRAVRVGLA